MLISLFQNPEFCKLFANSSIAKSMMPPLLYDKIKKNPKIMSEIYSKESLDMFVNILERSLKYKNNKKENEQYYENCKNIYKDLKEQGLLK